jgi:16S rRNA (cytosine1402-N4)-methyltransferase
MLHQPVLLQSVIDGLKVKKDGNYLDGTLGSGGHAAAILQKGGNLFGMDVDPEALEHTRVRLSQVKKGKFQLEKGNFAKMEEMAKTWQVDQFSGILLDLGLSSDQLADVVRGFSFQGLAPLDMRADPDLQVTAADLINGLNEGELNQLFFKLGEETKALRIAKALVAARKEKPLETTADLVAVIDQVYRGQRGKIHPATKVFQALRIAVNDELNNLSTALPQAVSLLKPGGRLAVISFHSLEDRIVKQFIKDNSNLLNLTKKPIVADSKELAINPRARSAKLRIAEKK